jgi:hypothetical protein
MSIICASKWIQIDIVWTTKLYISLRYTISVRVYMHPSLYENVMIFWRYVVEIRQILDLNIVSII